MFSKFLARRVVFGYNICSEITLEYVVWYHLNAWVEWCLLRFWNGED